MKTKKFRLVSFRLFLSKFFSLDFFHFSRFSRFIYFFSILFSFRFMKNFSLRFVYFIPIFSLPGCAKKIIHGLEISRLTTYRGPVRWFLHISRSRRPGLERLNIFDHVLHRPTFCLVASIFYNVLKQ